jgi:hypothetical protein
VAWDAGRNQISQGLLCCDQEFRLDLEAQDKRILQGSVEVGGGLAQVFLTCLEEAGVEIVLATPSQVGR